MLEWRLDELNLDKNVVRGSNPHQHFQKSLVRVHIDEPFMNSHLPLVESVCALARGRFSGWDHQLLRWEGNRSLQLHTGLVRDLFDFRAYCVDILGVRAGQSDSSFGDHSEIPSSFYISRSSQPAPVLLKTLVS